MVKTTLKTEAQTHLNHIIGNLIKANENPTPYTSAQISEWWKEAKKLHKIINSK